ncbi:MAG TPA: radical SAM protein [Candidatus Diapherotrites archaeon]|uniref:Radical SAM protein n=1 Tax=Candidatus Iainarchaeum sp. TaxID=3101447 RepID=A0A7J4J122_9ARCH|nr:radical SAM protein [Candidatus Diapherotrites archaeon]
MKIYPCVPKVFEGNFPANYINDVNGWAFSKKELENNKGKLLTLDIDFGNFCSLNCPHCFRRNNRVDIGARRPMGYDDLVELILSAKKLGLSSVKFLGAGEPFENLRFLEFLRFLRRNEIIPLIFTKGTVIGDDRLVAKWYSHYGIFSGEELVAELAKVNASILLGFNSFDPKVQDAMVGGIDGYTLKRNRALELLAAAGLNAKNPTSLALLCTPITNANFDEILDIYKWGRERNIYVVTCPTMVSGRCSGEAAWAKITPSEQKLIGLYTEVYKFNLEKGIQTFGQIKSEGIAAYAGAHPCNQLACGMYVTLSGKVLRCPGDDITIFGDIWKDSLENIWRNSENFRRAGTFNCGCPPKMGKSFPERFFEKVLAKLENELEVTVK